MPGKVRNVVDHFWRRVSCVGNVCKCWNWTGAVDGCGYGVVYLGLYGDKRAHRYAYKATVGPIPTDLEIDHLCSNRACCNPWHMELVTHAENVRRSDNSNRRKSACPRGHEYTVTRWQRICKQCRRMSCLSRALENRL